MSPGTDGLQALGSALPDPATAPRALPKSSRTLGPDSAGEGSPGPQVPGGWGTGAGECQVRVSLGCVQCVHVGIPPFQRSGEGVVVYTQPCHSLSSEAAVGLGLRPEPRQRLLGCARRAPGGRGVGGRLGGAGQRGRPGEPGRSASGGLRRPGGRAGKHRASALLPIFPVSVLYCFLLLKLTCLIGNWCRIVSRGLLWNISTAVSFN